MKKLIVLLAISCAIVGCTSPKQPLYYYGKYNTAVYAYLVADDITTAEQIDLLEKVIADAASINKPVAPGLHAHLGMLYFENGNEDLGMSHFNTEKALFPESVQYIDFLINKGKAS